MPGELKSKFQDKIYRDAYVAEHLKVVLASQIQALRNKYGWSQAELARRLGTSQNVISRLEDPDYGKFNLQTLLALASAFEVALLVKFVPFSQFAMEFADISAEKMMIPSFDEENAAAIVTGRAVEDEAKDTFDILTDSNAADSYGRAA